MNREQDFFIQILSDHISKRTTKPCQDIDWKIVTQLSRSHQVDGIVLFQCRGFIPDEYRELLEQAMRATLYYYNNRKVALKEMSDAFRESGIPFIVVKGFAITEYYPVPSLRTMGDCDIIVHQQNMPAAMRVMRNLGYQGIENERTHDWECVKKNLVFELHDSLVQSADHAGKVQRDFFNQYDEFVKDGVIDWNFHFLFLIMHLRKHFMNSGVGIRSFMDIAVILRYGAELRWDWIIAKLVYLDLYRFAQSCFYLLEKWFGVVAPINYSVLDYYTYTRVTEIVLSNGVFGFSNKNNGGNYERNLLIKSKGLLGLNRVLLLISFAFPPYSYMKSYPGCGYVNDNRYLLPIAWLHRYVIFFKRSNRTSVIEKIKNSFTPRKELGKQKDFLEKMGL